MTTPYDTALRIAERRLDAVQAEMATLASTLRLIEREEATAASDLQRESRLAGDDTRLTTEHYFDRARDYRAKLVEMRRAAETQLEALRCKAVAHYAERLAIDSAIARHHEEANRAAAAAEQAAADDLSGGRYRRPARRTPAAPNRLAALP